MEIGSLAEWIAAVATGLGAFVVILQIDRDHDRSRREKSVSLLREWTDRQQHQTRSAVKLVQTFDLNQCKQMVLRKEIKIDKSIEAIESINVVFRKTGMGDHNAFSAENFASENEEHILIPAPYSNELRFILTGYLNLIESILAAWNAGITDESILTEQFKFLHRKKEEQLTICRQAFEEENGGENPCPAMTNFLSKTEPKVARPLRLIGRFLPL